MKPVRVQRKRIKGWKMPKNTIYIGRPSQYGNHFKIGDQILSRREAVECYEDWIKPYIKYKTRLIKNIKEDLKGKNLACWCPLSEPCHGDVLLKIANE